VLEVLAALVARSLVVAEENGPQTRYRLLETIRQYGEGRLEAAGEAERWHARHASYYASLLPRVRDHARDPDEEVFWAVRLGDERDNLLAAWSWANGTGNVDTAFRMLAGFAPGEVRTSYQLLLPGEAALELPGAAEHPGYPLEEVILAARVNIAFAAGAFADAARLAEQAAGIARAGGDLAEASLELILASAGHLFAGDTPAAVPLAEEALALARQIGAPALIATSLLAVGAAVGSTDPGQARACLRESRELSTALGHQSARDLLWATGIAFLVNDQATTLELGRRAIHDLQWGGDRLRMGAVLHFIAGALAATQPDAAAIILGAADAYVTAPARVTQLTSLIVGTALGEERARELRTRGAGMGWDQALAYTLAQATQALAELQSQTQP